MTPLRTPRSKLLAVLLAALAPVACDDSSGPQGPEFDGTANLTILLTDAPIDYIAVAEVDIGRVELVPGGDGGHIVLSEDGTDGFVNLLDFQNSATMQIAQKEIEEGEYAQLRLIVEAARVELMEGYEFRDGTTEMDLKVPSGAQTGIKLILKSEDGGPLVISGETVLVLDFDVNRSFVLNGNFETPAGVHGVIFKPTIRVTGRDVAASISGTVSTELEGESVEGLTVVAEPVDGGDLEDFGYQTMTGTALTDENGDYTIWFLVPGTYDVSVEAPEGLGTDPATIEVTVGESANATGVDFELIDVSGSIAGTISTELEGVLLLGTTVTATPDGEGDPLTTEAGADGAYLFDGVIPGMYTVTIEVGDDQLSDPTEAVVDLGPGEDVVGVDFEIVEDLTGSIAGAVSTALEGFSVAGLTVTATPDGEGDPLTAVTGEDGTYLIDGVPADTYTVTVEVGEGFTTDPADETVEVANDEEVVDIDFEVIASGS